MTWRFQIGRCRDWYWFLDLPNGWTASVADTGQSQAPRVTGWYQAAAANRTSYVQAKNTYPTFELAKSAALELALQQPELKQVLPIVKEEEPHLKLEGRDKHFLESLHIAAD